MGNMGVGIGLAAPKMAVTIEDTIVAGAHAAGVEVVDTALALRRSIVRGVAQGKTNDLHEGNATVGPIADGVLFVGATGARGLTLEDVWIEDAVRAGVMASTGAHALTRVRVRGAAVGLALRDGATAAQADCDIVGSAAVTEDPSALLVP